MADEIPTTDLKAMQTWRSSRGAQPRQIQEIRTAGITDNKYPMGTLLVHWAVNAGTWGVCSRASFMAWIRKEGAYLK